MKVNWKIWTVCLLVHGLCFLSYGQRIGGSVVSGSAIDARGAIIPNAVITFVNGGKVFSAKTSSQAGDYSVALDPGEYRVSADASYLHFQPLRRSNILVLKDQLRTLNFEFSAPMAVFGAYEPKPAEPLDDAPYRSVFYSYDEIPKLSVSGVKNGLVSFGTKSETASSITYTSKPFDETSGAKVTFTYDFYTLTTDVLTYNKSEGAFVASGNVAIQGGQKNQLFRGDVKITFKDNKLLAFAIK